MTAADTEPRDGQDWAVLFYLCGHFNRADEVDPFLTAFEEIRAAGVPPGIRAALYLDLESGARRVALHHGEPADVEMLGASNSGDPETLDSFLSWAFDACGARHYVLVMAGLGILDAESVVGCPPFDSERIFAICDDRATDDAIELHELSATLRNAFPASAPRRLALLACDMYSMQFLEVAYELRDTADFLVGMQPESDYGGTPLLPWPYARLLRRWTEVLATTSAGQPEWLTGINERAAAVARETVALLGEHYANAPSTTVSALNLRALGALSQALDIFSVVYLQWLSNDVIWRARERVVEHYLQGLAHSWSYDVDEMAAAVRAALGEAAATALSRWAASELPHLPLPRLSRTLRVFAAGARELARRGTDDIYDVLAAEITQVRSSVERTIASDAAGQVRSAASAELLPALTRLFFEADGVTIRHGGAWSSIVVAAHHRLTPALGREVADILGGISAAEQISRLAGRVSQLARGADAGGHPAVTAVWSPHGRCGVALYRPLDLDKLAESNYLQLRFGRDLHWTALLTAVDLIQHHPRMLWRLVESQLTAAPLEARYELMRRLAGTRALTGRHADQLRALSAPEALFLTIEPDQDDDENVDDPVTSYCVRLSSLDRSAMLLECRNKVSRRRLDRVLRDMNAVGAAGVEQQPAETVQQLIRCGSLLGDDILHGVSDDLAALATTGDRPVHLVLQLPREMMRYPWELLRDRHGWLVERFAIGRQVIAEGGNAPRWSGIRPQGPLRLLVVAPAVSGHGSELAGAGVREGEHVASAFEHLHERLPGLVEPGDFRRYVGQPVTVDEFRTLLRESRADIVHFAGHGHYDPEHPDRSCWMFSDGPLYAFELRHTLANAAVLPWLVYGSACEAAAEGEASAHGYHDGVYGMASAALGQGVAAYIAPLWKLTDADAKNLAAAFYHALLLRRTSLGEALALARRLVKEGRLDFDDLATSIVEPTTTPRQGGRAICSSGWTAMVLYGDPTPNLLQRLSPSDASQALESDSARVHLAAET